MSSLLQKKIRLLSFGIYVCIALIYISLTFVLFKSEYKIWGYLSAILAVGGWFYCLYLREKTIKYLAGLSTLHAKDAFLFGYLVPLDIWNKWLSRNLLVNVLFLVIIFLVGTPMAAFALQLPESRNASSTDARAMLYSSAFVVASVQVALGCLLGLVASVLHYYYQKKQTPQVVFFGTGIRIGYQNFIFDLKKYPVLQMHINAHKQPPQLEIWTSKPNSGQNHIRAAAPATEQAAYFAALWKSKTKKG